MIDITYRIGGTGRGSRKTSLTPEQARRKLERGNSHFSDLIASMRSGKPLSHVALVSEQDIGAAGTECAVQSPYAAVLACSDARVPTEMILQQGFNDLFVVRVRETCSGTNVWGVSGMPRLTSRTPCA